MTGQGHTTSDAAERADAVSAEPCSGPNTLALSAGKGAGASRRCFRLGAITLCAVGLLMLCLGHGLARTLKEHLGGGRRGPQSEIQVLQALVTSNLAVFLTWVWLDLRARDRGELDGQTRFGLWLLAAYVAGVSSLTLAVTADAIEKQVFLPFMLFVVGPVLAVAVPLLWLAARRSVSYRQRAALLGGVVAAGALTQWLQGVGDDPEIQMCVLNSCLIGLAVVVWLLSWASTPELRRTA